MPEKKTTSSKAELKKIHQQALDHFDESCDATNFNRTDAYDDIKFSRLGEQWPDEIEAQRRAENRPCLTINRLPSFIRQVVNEARQNKPGIKVTAVDGGSDRNTAEVIAGLIRAIENGKRKAEIAYDTAIDHAVTSGFGFFRIGIDYVHGDTFDMEAYIERVPNPLLVHWDANTTAFDSSDWNYCLISEFITEEEFDLRYPGADKVPFEGASGDGLEQWVDEDRIRLAEYWYRTEKKRTICEFQNPSTGERRTERYDDAVKIARDFFELGGFDPSDLSDEDALAGFLDLTGFVKLREREATYHEVKRCILNGAGVLEEEDWPGTTIPIVPVWGEEVNVDGRRHFRSMIRDAKDSQTMFNFWRTASTEIVALQPKVPWVGPEGFRGVGAEAKKWEHANTVSYAYLEHVQGKEPSRQPFIGVPAGIINESATAADDMKALMGIYDSSLGARSNETSGKAILARQRESDVSNFHFIDNLNRAIEYAGRVLVEIIPSVYSEREAVRILGEDQKDRIIKLTQEDGGQLNADGESELYNLSVGRYDVMVESGPSYATQREEAREVLIEIMRTVPGSGLVIGDLLARNLDFVGADELEDRLKAMYQQSVQPPPGIPGQVPGQIPVPPGLNGQGGFPGPQ